MDAETRQELTRLADSVSSLELRVTALEETAVRPRAPLPVASVPESSPMGASGLFAKLALVCFALVGALFLRVATQQGLIDDTAGTAIGLGYCVVLAVGPLLARRMTWAGVHGSVLQIAGVVLVPLIVLEMFHRRGVFDVTGATSVLLLAGAGGCLLGGLGGQRLLTAMALLVGATGIASLGLEPAGAGVRAAGLVGLLTCGLISAHLRSWAGVRPAVLLPVLAALGLGILMTARRPGIPIDVPTTLVLAATGVWLLVVINHLARRARVQDGEAAWLVVTSVWWAGVVRFGSPNGATVAGLAAAALLIVGVLLVRGQSAGRAVHVALAGGLLAVASLPGLDPTGLGLAWVAFALWWINRTEKSDALDVAGAIAVVAAAATTLPGLVADGAAASEVVLSGLLLPSVLIGHWAVPAPSTRARQVLAPVSLVAGWVLLLFGTRAVFHSILDGDAFQLAMTLQLVGFSITSQAVGRRTGSKVWLVVGFAAIGLAGIKSGLWDLIHLAGPYAAASIVALGVGFGATSVLLRKARA